MTNEETTDKSVLEWLNGCKSEGTRQVYENNFRFWLEYSTKKGLLKSGSEQLEDIKQKRVSTDSTIMHACMQTKKTTCIQTKKYETP